MTTTLDIKTRCSILYIKDVLSSSILLLEDKDEKRHWKYSKNYGPYRLPIDDSIHPNLVVEPIGLPCFKCGE